jgi:hypothetical protein
MIDASAIPVVQAHDNIRVDRQRQCITCRPHFDGATRVVAAAGPALAETGNGGIVEFGARSRKRHLFDQIRERRGPGKRQRIAKTSDEAFRIALVLAETQVDHRVFMRIGRIQPADGLSNVIGATRPVKHCSPRSAT